MASRTRNSTIPAASVSESPSLLLPSLTVAHGQASSSIAATTSDIIALFSSLQLENSISYTIGAHHSMFDPSTTGVLGSDFVTNIPISRSIEQHYTTPFVSCFALTSVSIASQTQLNHTASAFLFFNPGIGLDGSLANFHLFQHHHGFDSNIHRPSHNSPEENALVPDHDGTSSHQKGIPQNVIDTNTHAPDLYEVPSTPKDSTTNSLLINDQMKFRCLWAISNETVAGIEISFKEKDTKYLEFLFVYYMDDLIREDHHWELFDRLSPRKRRNIINLTEEMVVSNEYTELAPCKK
ncbi:hypothetical protein F8388_021071 [Cannabis sativa]|uniref:Ycf2 N-terminal domain-containing protein n=1 Tax=Cannabis sativa TaxID=3483 RepID=A0A7J6GZQ5_CANSA|nr:hypothetical protein F8388_021071 [Cannabis sativa]